jgi:pyrimidine deaminase RibD-like protein
VEKENLSTLILALPGLTLLVNWFQKLDCQMDDALKLSLMREAIIEAHKSQAEDSRNHPLVGAIVTDDDGKILLRAHRGENAGGGHAEFLIFEKAKREGIDVNGKTLFVTLEPCTRRGPGKIPCAVRVGNSGISRVYIGTIDPNPSIIGRGELYLLSRGLEVDRFPYNLAKELLASNKAFFDDYTHYSAPVVALGDMAREKGSWKLPGNREAILQASLELMISSEGPVEIFSGGSSWVRELQVGLLYAALANRPIRILCEQADENESNFIMRKSAALASGASVAITKAPLGIRGTLTSPNSASSSLISIERSPTLHGLKLSSPHEKGVLEALTTLFNQEWRTALKWPARSPDIRPMEVQHVAEILRRHIPAYRDAVFREEDVQVGEMTLLSRNMERFKLFRIAVLEDLIAKHKLPKMGYIAGSPWPYLLPLVERDTSGKCVVIDGAHRLYHAVQKGKESIRAITIEGANAPLPSKPLESLDEVKVTSDKWPRSDRYVDFAPQHFRGIRDALESDLWSSTN